MAGVEAIFSCGQAYRLISLPTTSGTQNRLQVLQDFIWGANQTELCTKLFVKAQFDWAHCLSAAGLSSSSGDQAWLPGQVGWKVILSSGQGYEFTSFPLAKWQNQL